MLSSFVIGDMIPELYACNSVNDQFDVYSKYVTKLGFEGCSYAFIPHVVLDTNLHEKESPIFFKSRDFSETFLAEYTEQRFDQNDFTIRAIRENILHPLDWQASLHSNYLTDKEKDVIQIARSDHGICNAISIPIENNKAGISGVSLTTSLSDREFNEVKQEYLELLQLCTWTFHLASRDKSIYRYFAPSSLSDFSVKERMLLEAVVKGMTMAQIDASNIPISKRYGERLLYETRQRFGGISTHELVRTITLLGLL